MTPVRPAPLLYFPCLPCGQSETLENEEMKLYKELPCDALGRVSIQLLALSDSFVALAGLFMCANVGDNVSFACSLTTYLLSLCPFPQALTSDL